MADSLRDRLKDHEGYRRDLYRDTKGKLTIGYGHNLEANGLAANKEIARRIAELMLEDDIREAREQVERNISFFEELDTARQEVLIEMAFNMGIGSLLTFTNMLEALEQRDWQRAHDEALDSEWHREDVGKRAEVLAKILLTGRKDLTES